MIQCPWNEDDLDDYSEKESFGFNIFKLVGNKAELSPNFPGKSIFKMLFYYNDDTMVQRYHDTLRFIKILIVSKYCNQTVAVNSNFLDAKRSKSS